MGLDPQEALNLGNLQLLFLPVKLTVLRLLKGPDLDRFRVVFKE